MRLSGTARPKPRYGQALLRLDQRVLLFGGEAAGGIGGDLWALRGVVTVDGDVPPSWLPLELPGSQPAPRKGHAAACMSTHVILAVGDQLVVACCSLLKDWLVIDCLFAVACCLLIAC